MCEIGASTALKFDRRFGSNLLDRLQKKKMEYTFQQFPISKFPCKFGKSEWWFDGLGSVQIPGYSDVNSQILRFVCLDTSQRKGAKIWNELVTDMKKKTTPVYIAKRENIIEKRVSLETLLTVAYVCTKQAFTNSAKSFAMCGDEGDFFSLLMDVK